MPLGVGRAVDLQVERGRVEAGRGVVLAVPGVREAVGLALVLEVGLVVDRVGRGALVDDEQAARRERCRDALEEGVAALRRALQG